MKIKIKIGFGLLAFTILAHFVSLKLGLYSSDIIWIDKLLHLLIGLSLSLIVFGLLNSWRYTMYAVIGLAVLWELAEYVFRLKFPEIAYELQIFSPTIKEAFVDVVFNLLGLFIAGIFVRNQNENL